MSPGRVELDLVPIRDVAAFDLYGRERQLGVDLLGSILVSDLRTGDGERRHEVVERLVRCVWIRRRARKVVAALLVDDVVDVDVLEGA